MHHCGAHGRADARADARAHCCSWPLLLRVERGPHVPARLPVGPLCFFGLYLRGNFLDGCSHCGRDHWRSHRGARHERSHCGCDHWRSHRGSRHGRPHGCPRDWRTHVGAGPREVLLRL